MEILHVMHVYCVGITECYSYSFENRDKQGCAGLFCALFCIPVCHLHKYVISPFFCGCNKKI